MREVAIRDAKALLLENLASIRDPERAASLLAVDGAFALPFLRSLGVEPRHTGRREIAALLHRLLELYSTFAFAPGDIHVLIETPEKGGAGVCLDKLSFQGRRVSSSAHPRRAFGICLSVGRIGDANCPP
jgi:hypothetical protein